MCASVSLRVAVVLTILTVKSHVRLHADFSWTSFLSKDGGKCKFGNSHVSDRDVKICTQNQGEIGEAVELPETLLSAALGGVRGVELPCAVDEELVRETVRLHALFSIRLLQLCQVRTIVLIESTIISNNKRSIWPHPTFKAPGRRVTLQ